MQTKAIIQLIVASLLWGLGFVASSWSIRTFTSIESVTYRFLIAALLGQIVLLVFKKENSQFHLKDWLKALPAGILLGLMQLTQTIGLETTTSGKSAFITSLYILFVPLISSIFLKEPYRKINYLFCLLALAGTLFLVNPDFKDLQSGDLWTLVCALLAALHIIYTGFIADSVNELFRFNTYQSFWALILIAPALLLQSEIHFWTTDLKTILGLLYLCIGSSLIAFYLQLKAQKYLSNSVVTMITLLESPTAAIFGFLILAQAMSALQVFGAVCIMLSSSLMVYFNRHHENIIK